MLYFQLQRKKKNYLGANYLSMEVRPFTERQITSDEGVVPRTSFYVSIKCCAASCIVIEGKPGIRGIGSVVLGLLRGSHTEVDELRSSWVDYKLTWEAAPLRSPGDCPGLSLHWKACSVMDVQKKEISNKLASNVFQHVRDHNHIPVCRV